MAQTTFSGPVKSDNGFVFPVATAAELGDAADVINTSNKTVGKTVIDIATGVIYVATGTATTSDWKGSDATSITPA
jgi:hypothetical protein